MTIKITERLSLRKIDINDAPFILDLYNQAAFKQFIGDRGVHGIKAASAFIQKTQKHYQDYGFWLYIVEERTSGNPVGVNGLVKRDYLDAPDIGFAISDKYWGQGYAYESGLAVIDHAIQLKLTEILAITSKDNVSSIGLLSKLGFVDKGQIVTPDTDETVNLYRKFLIHES